MNETDLMIIALLTGLVVGMLFFGGLWLTVKKALASKTPALWFVGSFLFRVAIVLIGFYFIMQTNSWLNGVICLVGFIVSKFIIVRLTKAYELKTSTANKTEKGAIHEA